VVLRDALGLSVAETAEALEVGINNVKVAHHRARQKLADASARAPDVDQRARHGALLGELFVAIGGGDEQRVLELLGADVRALSDGGGVVRAARRVVVGARDVTRLLVGIARKGAPPVGVELREINCLPAFDAIYAAGDPRGASRAIFQGALGPSGQFSELHIILAPAKTAAVERAPWLRPLVCPAALLVP
jgi:RNA polymerase sigma-70 factor (ECF subfamily)